MENYIEYYNLEKYLLDSVRPRFQRERQLGAFDFFCIIIWKANRAKSKVAKSLLRNGKDLSEQVKQLTSQVFTATSNEEKLKVLLYGWGFRLPMASAILTVLYPDHFTVYDVRVCDVLHKHHKLGNLKKFESILSGYQEFISDVRNEEPKGLSLRDKDRFLWGKSFADQLGEDIRANFFKGK